MVKRNFWINRIKNCWEQKNIIWLAGIRRVGKTFLCKSLDNIEYFDCELPRIRKVLEDPEGFLNNHNGKQIVLDEIHRLKNPTELLKIAADHYPNIKIIATGSSVLSATTKFRDTLTGRKREIWLTPMILQDIKEFENPNINHRFLFGGLPGFFNEDVFPEKDYQEWIDGYWAKDIQELFKLEKRYAFQQFFELLLAQSGGIFNATKFSKLCELSRPSIKNYLSVLEKTFVVNLVRPFTTYKPSEITSAPKVYGFDTGFIAYFRGWDRLRLEDLGEMWEHFILNELYAHFQPLNIYYWRNKQGNEVDFIIKKRGGNLIAIECKWRSSNTNLKNLNAFIKNYPNSKLFVVAHDIDVPFHRSINGNKVNFVSLKSLITII